MYLTGDPAVEGSRPSHWGRTCPHADLPSNRTLSSDSSSPDLRLFLGDSFIHFTYSAQVALSVTCLFLPPKLGTSSYSCRFDDRLGDPRPDCREPVYQLDAAEKQDNDNQCQNQRLSQANAKTANTNHRFCRESIA